jgi:hypothetical protein
VESPAKLDPKCDQNELSAFLQRKKIKFELVVFAFLLALVLMDVPFGRPIFGSKIPDDLIRKIRKALREAEKMGLYLEQVDPEGSLSEAVLEGRHRGQPAKKKYTIVCLWALLAKHADEVPWSMLARLRRWFYEQLEGKNYREQIRGRINTKNVSKDLKKKCLPKIDQNLEIIVPYLRAWISDRPQRKFFPRAVDFAKDSIEVEVDYKNGDGLKTVRWKKDFNTQEFTGLDLDPSEARDFGSVTFSD